MSKVSGWTNAKTFVASFWCMDCQAARRINASQHLSVRYISQPSSSSCMPGSSSCMVPRLGSSLLPCTCLSAQHASSACCWHLQ